MWLSRGLFVCLSWRLCVIIRGLCVWLSGVGVCSYQRGCVWLSGAVGLLSQMQLSEIRGLQPAPVPS